VAVKRLWNKEPVWLTTVAAAVLTVLVEFGVNLTAGQRTALLALVAAVAAGVIRHEVWSEDEHQREVESLKQQTDT
jgi:hypothetical protein